MSDKLDDVVASDEVVDLRPVPLDSLATFSLDVLEQRHERAQMLTLLYQDKVLAQEAYIEQLRKVHRFVEDEQEKAKLAISLSKGDVVRVVCPQCKGSGLKPVDATSGRIQRKSAFETIGSGPSKILTPSDVDESEHCIICHGHKWILMDRFKG